MDSREYCHWIKGALDMGGDAALASPQGLSRALSALPAEAAGQGAASGFCAWFASVAADSAQGLPAKLLAQARSRLDAVVEACKPAAMPQQLATEYGVYLC